MISPEEKKQLLLGFNATTADYPLDKTLHELFKIQAEKTPENIAVMLHNGRSSSGPDRRTLYSQNLNPPTPSRDSQQGCRGESMYSPGVSMPSDCISLTYRQLDEKADTLALLLRSKGVGPGTIVGIMVERSLEMKIGIFSILKAGGAYLPISPGLPAARKEYMLKDSNAKVLLTTSDLYPEVEKLSNLEVETVYIEESVIRENQDRSDVYLLESDVGAQRAVPGEECRGEPCVRPSLYSPDADVGNHSGIPFPGAPLRGGAFRVQESVMEYSSGPGETQPGLIGAAPRMAVGRGGLKDGAKRSSPHHSSFITHHLAYVIYTSGSTGKPKGVMIEHHSLVNRLNWMQKKYPLDESDTLLQKTPFFFDVSVWELFWWSMTGARLCFLPPGVEKFPQAIIEAVERNRVTVIHFVPSMLSTFLEYLRGKDDEIRRLAGLKRIFVSGEALAPTHLRAFNEILYKTNLTEIVNLYGPTEATVDVSYFDCPPGENLEKIPIGRPIDNINLFILDKNMQLQSIGDKGELCISGVGLARGYLNNPELTAEKFGSAKRMAGTKVTELRRAAAKRSPTHVGPWTPAKTSDKCHVGHHSSFITHHSALLYKSGDLARWLPDGNIEFLGRLDHQVKIRGLRIELGEIESVLLNHDSIRDCVVSVKKYSENIVIIVAYIVLKNAERTAHSAEPVRANLKFARGTSPSDLRDYLSHSLPGYMIPGSFVFLESFPTTPSGKVDRKVLPEPQF